MYPKLFWPPEPFWECCCQETWVSDYFCYIDVLSDHWFSQTNLTLKKHGQNRFDIPSTLGHNEEGKGKKLFWRIDGVGATYTDSFIPGSSQVLASLSAFGELSVISLSWSRWTIFEPYCFSLARSFFFGHPPNFLAPPPRYLWTLRYLKCIDGIKQ